MANETGKPVWIRQVIVPGINDFEQNVLDLKEFANVHVSNLYRIELLGYHTMAVKKWDKLGLDYKLRSTSAMDKKGWPSSAASSSSTLRFCIKPSYSSGLKFFTSGTSTSLLK